MRTSMPTLALRLAGISLALFLGLVGCSGDGDAPSGGHGGGMGSGGGSGTAAGPSTGPGMTSRTPVIVSFSADPPNLPEGGGQSTLRWKVQNADSLSIDQGVGTVTGDSKNVTVGETTIYTLTAENAEGTVTATTAVVTGHHPSESGGRNVAMIAPTGGESFLAPATLRLVASGYDPNVYTNEPMDGLGANAAQVQFFVDDESVLDVDGANAEYNIFKGFAAGIGKGTHLVWARAIYKNPDLVLDSEPMVVTVADPPAYDKTVDLTEDVVLSGAKGYSLVGTADKRVRLNGNGFRIRSSGGSGALTLKFVDVFDLGDRDDTSEPGIEVATSGNATIEDATFDTSNTVMFTLTGASKASIRRNVFRSNMRMQIGQFPDGYGQPKGSFPVVRLEGESTGAKVFAGNNVGAGWVRVANAKKWVVGGESDEDTNVLIGPRVGIHVVDSSDIEVRRNFSHHVYYGGWSQGNNFELQGSSDITVEHNIIFGSSWPVRGAGCEFRYNLVLDAGHQWLWVEPHARIHHNIFAGGQNDVGGIYVLYDPADVSLTNNTFDGLLTNSMTTAIQHEDGTVKLRSNAFLNFPNAPTVTIGEGTLTADYNLFANPQNGDYSDSRSPSHDVTTDDAKLTDPPTVTFDFDESSIWTRNTTAASILATYRTRYTPKAGSPLIDAGDPADGAGNDIGAVGAGQQDDADKFGLP